MLRNELKIAIRFTLLTTVLLGILYPLAVTGIGQLSTAPPGGRRVDRHQRPGDGLAADRPELHRGPVFSWTPFGRGQRL